MIRRGRDAARGAGVSRPGRLVGRWTVAARCALAGAACAASFAQAQTAPGAADPVLLRQAIARVEAELARNAAERARVDRELTQLMQQAERLRADQVRLQSDQSRLQAELQQLRSQLR